MPDLMTFSDYWIAFDEIYSSGRAPALRGGIAPFDKRRRSVLRSYWDALADFVAAQTASDTAAGDVPVAPYVAHLDHWARRAAEFDGHSVDSRNNMVSAIRFIRGAVEAEGGRVRIYGREEQLASMPAAWRVGYEALTAVSAKWANSLGTAIRVAVLHGKNSPKDAPCDVATWKTWASAIGARPSAALMWQTAINKAGHVLSPKTPWLRVVSASAPACRGVRQIPDLEAKLRAAGEKRPVKDLSGRAVVKALYPAVGHALEDLMKHRTPRTRRASDKHVLAAVGRLCYALDQLGAPADFELPDLWTKTVATTDPGVEVASSTWRSKYDLQDDERRVTYARAFLEMNARASARRSPLHVQDPSEELPFFTATAAQDLRFIWDMTDKGHVVRLSKSEAGRALWARAVAEYDILARHIAEYNEGRDVMGRLDPEKLLELITLPQMVLMGCGELRRRALHHRERWVEAGCALEGNAWRTYREACWEWAVATVILCDGLRIKNYAGALVNRHVIPEWRGDRVVGLRTHFWGLSDEERVRLKKTWADSTKSRGNTRENVIYPAVLDELLLTDFMSVVRGDRLFSAGIIASVAALTRATDRFALFPSTWSDDDSRDRIPEKAVNPKTGAPWSPQQQPGAFTGRYSRTERLSDQLGRIVHWMIRDVMRREIPEWGSPEIKAAFRGLFGAHRPSRAGNASFWGYEADDWEYAKFITNDELKTLAKHYARKQNPSGIARLDKRTGLYRVGHFVNIMRHIRDGGAVEWGRFDPEHPDRAIVTEIEAARRKRVRRPAA